MRYVPHGEHALAHLPKCSHNETKGISGRMPCMWSIAGIAGIGLPTGGKVRGPSRRDKVEGMRMKVE